MEDGIDVAAEAPVETAVEGDVQESQSPEAAPEHKVDDNFIPKERFNKVYGQFSEYKKLGKLSDLQTRLQKLDQYEKALEAHRLKNQGTDENRAIKERLFEVAPELKQILDGFGKMGTLEQQIAELKQATFNQRMEKADSYTETKLTSLFPNTKLTEAEVTDVKKLTWISMTPDEQAEFKNGDFAVFDDALARISKSGLLSRVMSGATVVKPTPKAPVRVGSQGSPSINTKPDGTMSDLHRQAWDMISQKE